MIKWVNHLLFESSIKVNATEVTSKFHFTSLDHIWSIPFHLISTPKCPINFEKSTHQNIKLPPRLYKGMKMEHYCQEFKYDYELLKQFGVYIHSEDTSIIFEIIESSSLKD